MRNSWLSLLSIFAATLMLATGGAKAQDGPFGDGWVLDRSQSTLTFQSIKNNSVVEASTFATYTGTIDQSGTAQVEVQLDSVDTKVDLRNVRMRFLFFETFQYPTATITAQLRESDLADLQTVRRKNISLPFVMDLHGVSKDLTADVTITLLGPNLVSVATTTPLALNVADFNLMPGITKLQEAANVQIVPSSTITFDFVFARNGTEGAAVASAVTSDPVVAEGDSGSFALETQGEFGAEECVGRFEILSRAGNIYFVPGGAQLNDASVALLDTLYDVVSRCPQMMIEVGGHTDSDGSSALNQRLSEARARSVANYLTGKGIQAERLEVRGYGEGSPVVANDTPENKARNRRIEFKVVGQ
ncbi:OmpA family protein [Algicella marina]|nr:OmpA family protein [Algicella marina]